MFGKYRMSISTLDSYLRAKCERKERVLHKISKRRARYLIFREVKNAYK